jgi:hypothetical protein
LSPSCSRPTDPAQSDREIAKATDTSPTTVGKVRRSTGATSVTRKGADGRTTKPAPRPAPAVVPKFDLSADVAKISGMLAAIRKQDDPDHGSLHRLMGILRDGYLWAVFEHHDEAEQARQWEKLQTRFKKETDDE